jgi:hypothetical protein
VDETVVQRLYMPSGKSILIGGVVVFVVLVAFGLRERESPKKSVSTVALVLALVVVPLIGMAVFFLADKVARSLVVSLRVRDVLLLSSLLVPALLSTFIARWGRPTNWFIAIALGLVSAGIAFFLTFVPFIKELLGRSGEGSSASAR